MKKIIKVVMIVIILIIVISLILFSTLNNNKKYLNTITKNINKNYKLEEKITYSNKYGNYYIFTTKNNVIVLNKEYEEILKEDIEILSENKNKYEIIYKNNKLMYEETILKKGNLIYKYYDVTNNELIKETNLEKK